MGELPVADLSSRICAPDMRLLGIPYLPLLVFTFFFLLVATGKLSGALTEDEEATTRRQSGIMARRGTNFIFNFNQISTNCHRACYFNPRRKMCWYRPRFGSGRCLE